MRGVRVLVSGCWTTKRMVAREVGGGKGLKKLEPGRVREMRGRLTEGAEKPRDTSRRLMHAPGRKCVLRARRDSRCSLEQRFGTYDESHMQISTAAELSTCLDWQRHTHAVQCMRSLGPNTRQVRPLLPWPHPVCGSRGTCATAHPLRWSLATQMVPRNSDGPSPHDET